MDQIVCAVRACVDLLPVRESFVAEVMRRIEAEDGPAQLAGERRRSPGPPRQRRVRRHPS